MKISWKHRKTVGILLNSDNDISFITCVSYSHLNCMLYRPIIYGLFGLLKIRTRTGFPIYAVSLHLLTMMNIQKERNTEKFMSISSYHWSQPHTPHSIFHTHKTVVHKRSKFKRSKRWLRNRENGKWCPWFEMVMPKRWVSFALRTIQYQWHFIKRSLLCNCESFSLYIVYAYQGILNIGHFWISIQIEFSIFPPKN